MEFTNDVALLGVIGEDGETLAHKQIREGWITEDPQILKLRNKDGRTVAHRQAALLYPMSGKHWTTEEPEILKLADEDGRTVAHYQAEKGWTTDNPEILKLVDGEGLTVAKVINPYLVPPHILALEGEDAKEAFKELYKALGVALSWPHLLIEGFLAESRFLKGAYSEKFASRDYDYDDFFDLGLDED